MTDDPDESLVPDPFEAEGGDVLIRPLDGRTVVVVGRDDGSGDWHPVAAAVAQTVRAALGLGDGAPVGERRFAMSPESLRHLDADKTQRVGEYFRGVLTNSDGSGHYSHQVQLKEVHGSPVALDPAAALVAVQIAAMQAQLDRITDLLEEATAKVDAIKDHLDIQQAAAANGALGTVRRVLEDVRGRGGTVGENDWSRLAHLEYAMASALDAVQQELDRVADALVFTGSADQDVKTIRGISPHRVHTLLQMHVALEAGMRRWVYLMAVRKHEVGEDDPAALARHYADLDAAAEHRKEVASRIFKAIATAPEAEGRPWYQLLFTDGLKRGWDKDEDRVEAVEAFKNEVKADQLLSKARRNLSGTKARLQVVKPEDPEEGAA